jgi:hypothetical protein
MKVRTIAMILTLLVAGLAIGCSSAPEAPVPNFSEQEAIAIARSYQKHSAKTESCFDTEGQNPTDYDYTDFRHITSATFKANGIWLVTANTSYNYERRDKSKSYFGRPSGSEEYDCLYLVDDATGKVRPN